MEPAVLTSKTWTEADLQALPEDGYIHELVDGELVMSPKNDFFHGSISSQLSMIQRRLPGAGGFLEGEDWVHPDTATVAQTSKSAVSRVSKPAKLTNSVGMPAWKPAIQQVGNLRYSVAFVRRIVAVSRCTREDLLPGFRFAIAELFEEGDWQ